MEDITLIKLVAIVALTLLEVANLLTSNVDGGIRDC